MQTPMARVLEPEVMDSPEEARDYDAMDHREVNERFCFDLLAEAPIGPTVLDVGTGTARIPIELCKRAPHVGVVAIDLASHMLAIAEKNVRDAGLRDRVRVQLTDAKRLAFEAGSFATTISNSIIHHIPDPRGTFAEMARVTSSGGLVFVRDLARPADDAEVSRLVTLYAGTPPSDPTKLAAFETQRELLRASLKAALTPAEVLEMATESGLNGCTVRLTSDRHWTLSFRKP